VAVPPELLEAIEALLRTWDEQRENFDVEWSTLADEMAALRSAYNEWMDVEPAGS
jgi:hypothetical protein